MNLAEFGLNLDTDDLKQAGNLGLWKAVPKFDTAHGMKFLTYAAPAIRNAMIHFYRKPLEYAQMVLRRRWSIIFPSAAPMAGRRVCSLIIA